MTSQRVLTQYVNCSECGHPFAMEDQDGNVTCYSCGEGEHYDDEDEEF